MACLHKFHEYLNLDRIDFEPTTLIVGTFNPSWPPGNNAEWFYGRTNNNYLWDVLPRLYNPNINLRSATPEQWKQFCSQNKIAFTDMIYCINDACENNIEHQDILSTYLDTTIADYFEDFNFTDLSLLIHQHPTIRNIYFTRQDGVLLFDNQWESVETYAINNPNRNLHIRKLLTPSANARFKINPYRLDNPNDPTPLRNFIFDSWKQQWHDL